MDSIGTINVDKYIYGGTVMGIFDKIKKAIVGSGEGVTAKPSISNSKSTAGNLSIQESENSVEPKKPACPHGDCVITKGPGYIDFLFCTCEKSIEFDKKEEY